MQLIGYKAYRKGFFGCLETEDSYTCFLFSRNTYRAVTTYAKADFACHDHFLATLHKFLPRHFFLHRPVPLASLEARDLAAAACSLTPDGANAPTLLPDDRSVVDKRYTRRR